MKSISSLITVLSINFPKHSVNESIHFDATVRGAVVNEKTEECRKEDNKNGEKKKDQRQ